MSRILKFLNFWAAKEVYSQLSFAHPYCPLEIVAESCGRQVMEELIAKSAGIQRISAAISRLIDDDEGARALAKGLHRAIEDRMRSMAVVVDSPTKYGYGESNPDPGPYPLDRYCATALGRAAGNENVASRLQLAGWRLDLSFADGLRFRIKLLLAAIFVAGRAVVLLMRRGTRRVTPHRTVSLLENFTNSDTFEALADAASAAGYRDPNQFTMIVGLDNELPKKGYRFLYPRDLRVPVSDWCRQVILPTWRLAFSMIHFAFVGRVEDRFAAFEALRIASTALSIWPKAMNVRCRTVVDHIDYLPISVLKGTIFRKYGAKLLRWPGTEIDTYGSLLSNSAHDHFISSGHYLSDAFSDNWRRPQGARTIGLVQADRRLADSALVDPALKRRIDALQKDRKMLVYFGSGVETNMAPFISLVFRSVMEIFSRNPEWFMVIKSKRRTTFMDLIRSMPEFSDWQGDERIVMIDYEMDTSKEICPSGWLTEIMDLGTGYFGSTLAECAGRSRPYCTHLPVVYDTPMMRRLVENDVVVTDLERFKSRFEAALNGTVPSIPAEWGKWAVDPYQDDRALERLSAILIDDSPPLSQKWQNTDEESA